MNSKINIAELIKNETLIYQDKTAVKDDNGSFTYRELFLYTELLAEKLFEKGITKNKTVAVQYPDSCEYIIICLAVLSIGAVIAPASASMPETELGKLVNELEADFLLYKNTQGPDYIKITPESQFKLGIIQYSSAGDKNFYKMTSLNPAFIRFSSGTTGRSKGVLISHEAIVERTDAANSVLSITSEDNIVWLLDMSFHFVVTILLFLRKAATIILCSKQFPASFYRALKLCNITFLYASPFHYKMIIESNMFTEKMFRDIRLAISTAMKLPTSTAEAFYNKFKLGLSEAYGIIEVGLPFIHYPYDFRKNGSVGKINPRYKIKIIHPDSEGTGRITIKGPGFFSAYLKPFQLFNNLYPDGWFDTGDVGYIDKDGFLFIIGRKKDLINFAGMKVFPYKIEAVIQNIPSVKEVRIYGKKHETFGEIPCAAIVLNNGCNRKNEELEIKKFCYKNLALYEVPKKIEFVNYIEKTSSGKIRRY